MILSERSYSGKVFRPRPEIHCDPSGNLCIIATPWGHRSSARKVIQHIVDFFMSARSDEEVTSPFQVLENLTPTANNLRVAVMLANDSIFREENRAEYLTGIELFVAAKNQNELTWLQIGGPHVYLDRPGYELKAIGVDTDWSASYSNQHLLAPLPSQLLGLAATSNFAVHSIHVESDDRLVVVQRSVIPASLLAAQRSQRNLNHMSQILARQSTDLPFWLGLVEL
jgi:hypothetical protein